ncbi:MAG TPA: aminotransferase class IV [Polyangia bacterium]|nr:aminotransferase class IV [Polyangia bacterium]
MPARVWIDGAPVEADGARVSVFDRGFLYGDSVYEVFRTCEGRPFKQREHLERLERSAAGLEMTLPPRDEIERAVAETLAAAAEPDAYVRVVVTRGAGELGLDPAMADRPRLIVIVRAIKLPPPEAYRDGVEVALVGKSRSAPGAVDPSVKSGNYLQSVLAVAMAHRQGAYEAILCDGVGRITEGSSSNFFVVRGRRVATPGLSVGLLEGITRRTVIDLLRADGTAVDEVPLWPIDLRSADEAFITSSVRGVLPVVRVDGAAIAGGRPGAITRRVLDLYDRELHRA